MNRAGQRDLARAAKLQVLMLTLVLGRPCLSQTNVNDKPGSTRLVIVSVPDRELAVLENGSVVATFRVAVGATDTPSPTGKFQIINRISNPTYYHPGTVIPGSKNNPIGTRWVGLSKKGYGIHGTNAPKSVGRAASHGCIRLRNRDMEQLFTMLRVGDAVEIHGERDEQVARVFGTAPDQNTLATINGLVQDSGQ